MTESKETLARRVQTILEQRQIWVLATWTIAILSIAISIAKTRPLWFDEISTMEISRPDSPLGILEQIRRGFDQQPPPFFMITRLGYLFTRNEQIAVRLPGIFGFWLMTLCIYRFVQRRSGVLPGLLAIGFVMNTLAVRYMVEARPYGLILGFSGLALVCWQAVRDEKYRGWAIAGMALGIAGAISSNYYGVLLLFALACGEVIRAIMRRRRGQAWLDVSVWLSMAAGVASVLPWLAQARLTMQAFGGRNWATPGPMAFLPVYRDLIPLAPLLLIAGTIIAGIHAATKSDETGNDRCAKFGADEIGAAIALALIPFAGLALALIKTNAYTARYVIDGAMGIGILLAVATWNGIRGRAEIALCLLVITLSAGAVYQRHLFSYTKPHGATTAAEIARITDDQAANLPIAMDSPLASLESMHYGSPEITSRLVFLVDDVDQPRYAAVPYPARFWLELAQAWPWVHADLFERFTQQNRRFLLADIPSDEDYLLPLLEARHAEIQRIRSGAGMTLYSVNMDGAGSTNQNVTDPGRAGASVR